MNFLSAETFYIAFLAVDGFFYEM